MMLNKLCWTTLLHLLILLLPVALSYNIPKPQPTNGISRRSMLTTITTTTTGIIPALTLSVPASSAAFFEQNQDRRQLELCIVNILRLQYWAQTIVYTLETSDSLDARKQAYLEARLGGKAVVAEKQKVGGGASLKVFTLKGLQIKDCLKDLKYYANRIQKNKQMDRLNDDLIESLASLVEFDGLETTQDPSPRSSLTLGMYNADKEIYVKRMLSERIIGLIKDIVDIFDPTVRERCEQYVAEYYPNELPPKKVEPSSETVGIAQQE